MAKILRSWPRRCEIVAVAAVFSLVIYVFALSRRLPTELVRERMESDADELDQPSSASPPVAAEA